MGAEEQPRDDQGRFSTTGGGGGKRDASAWAGQHHEQLELAQKLGVREVTPAQFKKSFDAAFKDNPYSAFVSHYSEKELEGMTCLTSKDGKAGVAVHDHGDGRVEGTALFSTSESKGAGIAMLAHAMANKGVNYVECYAGFLDHAYAKLGFVEQTRDPFNKEYAAAGWDYAKFGTPDYVTMRHKV
jgi:hypothetical protein